MSAKQKESSPSPGDVPAEEYLRKRVPAPSDSAGIINLEVLDQIREMDDDDEAEDEGEEKNAFSKQIVYEYFDQAEATFVQLEDALANANLTELSSLGHFLKGSSAAVGIIKVTDACEKIQHYGKKRDEEAGLDLEEKEALGKIREQFWSCMKEYRVARAWLKGLYEDAAA